MTTMTVPPSTRPRRAELRLTRRGRVVVTLLFLLLALTALTLFSGYSAATDARGDTVPTRTVEVQEGDTLWAIASGVAGPGEVREVVHEIQELNSLSDVGLVEGQRIAVPVR